MSQPGHVLHWGHWPSSSGLGVGSTGLCPHAETSSQLSGAPLPRPEGPSRAQLPQEQLEPHGRKQRKPPEPSESSCHSCQLPLERL